MRRSHLSVAILKVWVLVAVVGLAVGLAASNARAAQEPVVKIETPVAGVTVFGIVQVKGFILDERAISNVTLLVDGAAVHDVDLNQPRADLQRRYPNFFGGNPFPYDPGFLTSFLAENFPDGAHTVAIQVTYADETLPDGTPESEVFEQREVIVDSSINQPPIGALDSPRDELIFGEQDIISGIYPITGWALDDIAIRTTIAADGKVRADIEVMVDRRVVGQSLWGLPRPDVANAHPDVPAALTSGWLMNLNTARITNGRHTISVRAWDTLGKSRIIGTRSVWIDNHYATLRPFGKIDWPMNNGHFYSNECIEGGLPSGLEFDPAEHSDWVSGWVVDQNDQANFEGVVYVELLFNGALIYSTVTDCGPFPFVIWSTYDANCYGFERPDVLYYYPQFDMDAKYSGFLFAFKTGYFINQGLLHSGVNIVSVRVGTRDPTRPAVIIDQVPVIVDCNSDFDSPAFGDLEAPVVMKDMKGSELIKGWVIDINGGIKYLKFYVDGILDGTLTAGSPNLGMPRLDVAAKYPWLPYPYNTYNGFQYTMDTSKYVDGQHQLVIEAWDMNNNHSYWVQRPVVFNNIP